MGRNKRKFSSIGDIVGNVRRLVLIVDDEEINRLILGNIMGPQYQIAYAVDGVEALKFVQENYRNLSAVLLDLNSKRKRCSACRKGPVTFSPNRTTCRKFSGPG